MRRILLYLLILLSAPCWAATYKLVTDASDLKEGDKIIISSIGTKAWLLTSKASSSSLYATPGFLSNDNIWLFNPLSTVVEFSLEGTSSAWYLKASDGVYLASPKSNSKNVLLLGGKNGNSTKTSIKIEASHIATITFDNTCHIYFSGEQYQSFKSASSSNVNIFIYKRVDEQPSVVGSSEYCSNKKAIEEWMNKQMNKQMDITLYRSFVADGGYYTLCLPFDVKQEQLKTVFGESTEAFSFVNASIANGEYNVYLSAETGILTAGTPYIIKPSKDVTNPVFNDVTVIASIGKPVTSNQVTFKGILDPSKMTKDNKLQRFLGGNDGLSLLYPNAKAAIYPTRAYFEFPSASNAKIGFSDETPNGLDQVSAPSCTAKSYFTLDGRMLENKPTHDGIYIMDGHKVILHKR
ncbi:MAG: hypothetical protein SO442_03780 [Prevotella sp.]|nr:hypothetical protein [Prevotella sp.]MDY5259505.1 hypothetical protein [Prevotella sp.]